MDNKTDNDFRHLTEFAGEVDDNCATGNDIEDLIKVVNFVNELSKNDDRSRIDIDFLQRNGFC